MEPVEFHPNLRQKMAVQFLRFAEGVFLRVHGWKSRPVRGQNIHGNYDPPTTYPFKRNHPYVRVHAVNAQRQVYAVVTKQGKQ